MLFPNHTEFEKKGRILGSSKKVPDVDSPPSTEDHEVEVPFAVKVYPNPSTKVLFLKSNSDSRVQYELYSVEGRQILSDSFNNTVRIDVTALIKGMYLIRFTSDKLEVQNSRIIIQ